MSDSALTKLLDLLKESVIMEDMEGMYDIGVTDDFITDVTITYGELREIRDLVRELEGTLG